MLLHDTFKWTKLDSLTVKFNLTNMTIKEAVATQSDAVLSENISTISALNIDDREAEITSLYLGSPIVELQKNPVFAEQNSLSPNE